MSPNAILEQLAQYHPWNEQEEQDRDLIYNWILHNGNAFERSNSVAHVTVSAWVVNQNASKVLMAYHKIYNSWAWLGGHADGETDLLAVAIRETKEESGLQQVHPAAEGIFSLEVLTVDGHEKHGAYVSSHLHLNFTYLLQADDRQPLRIKDDENSGVAWFTPEEALQHSTEPWFCSRIYSKLIEKQRMKEKPSL